MTRSRLYAFPWFPENSWQRLMYGADPAVRVIDTWRIDDAVDDPDPTTATLHLNWTDAVTQTVSSAAASMRAADAALDSVRRFRDRGGRVVWTIHNVLPHECRFLVPELALCQGLADDVDVIHVMNPDTARLVAPYYRLDPDRVVVLPHPVYPGVHDPRIDREEARGRLGLDLEGRLAVTIGQMRPYKNVGTLADAVAALTETESRRWRFAAVGRFSHGCDPAEIRHRSGDRMEVVDAFLDEDDLRLWLAAADAVVLPYGDVLNSGVRELAASAHRPVVVQDTQATRHLEGSGWAFPRHVGDGGARLVDTLDEVIGRDVEEALRKHRAAVAPERISAAFLALALNN